MRRKFSDEELYDVWNIDRSWAGVSDPKILDLMRGMVHLRSMKTVEIRNLSRKMETVARNDRKLISIVGILHARTKDVLEGNLHRYPELMSDQELIRHATGAENVTNASAMINKPVSASTAVIPFSKMLGPFLANVSFWGSQVESHYADRQRAYKKELKKRKQKTN